MESQKKNNFPNPTPFDYQQLTEKIISFEKRYPFLRYQYIGTSILGKGIPALTLGNGHRSVIYVGAHHGMEWLTSVLLIQFIEDFCNLYESGGLAGKTSVRAVFSTHTITVIPMLNPDGVDYQIHGIDSDNPLFERLKRSNPSMDFSNWQANARGVDLNHNYDAGFWEYKILEKENDIKEGATRYSGESPESEPEVAAICNLIRFQKDLRGVMTLHTQGEEICYPFHSTVPKGAHAIARHLSLLTGYTINTGNGLSSYGGLSDWCNQKMSIPSFTIECGKGKNPLPIHAMPGIYTNLKNAFFAFPTLL